MKKVIYVILIILIVIFVLIGMSIFRYYERINFNYEEKIWQPYLPGDIMMFTSNKGDSVHWNIFRIENESNPVGPQFSFGQYFYSTSVNTFCNRKRIIFIRRDRDVKTIYFEPSFEMGSIHIVENENKQINLDSIQYNQMGLFKITPHKSDLRIKPYQTTIYWSPQLGYVKVFYSDGVVWELKSFIRGGKVLYEMKDK